MRPMPVEQAVGRRLACDMTGITASEVRTILAKGAQIEPAHVAMLLDAGHGVVYVTEDDGPDADPSLVAEDDAALELARALGGGGLTVRPAGSGRALLLAQGDGLVRIRQEACARLNESDVALVVSVPPHGVARAGRLVAAVDLVPLQVPAAVLSELVADVAQGGPAIEVRPFTLRRVGLVITGSEVYEGRVSDLVAPVVRAAVARYDGEAGAVAFAPDDEERIAGAILGLLAAHDVVVVTGGMSVDPTDRTPAAIRRVADRVVKYGIPVLPNAMSMVAYRGAVPILGISSGIIHYPGENILDRLLPLAMSGEPITRAELVAAGTGGLGAAFVADLERRA